MNGASADPNSVEGGEIDTAFLGCCRMVGDGCSNGLMDYHAFSNFSRTYQEPHSSWA